MRKHKWIVWVLVAMAWVAGAALLDELSGAGARPRTPAEGLLAPLQKGQSVQIRDLGDVVIVRTLPDGHSTDLTLDEVADDYIVIRDSARVKTRIPLHSIKSIIVTP
jgi:hypothetical protein